MVIFKIDVYLQRIKRSFFDLYSILINNKLPSFPILYKKQIIFS